MKIFIFIFKATIPVYFTYVILDMMCKTHPHLEDYHYLVFGYFLIGLSWILWFLPDLTIKINDPFLLVLFKKIINFIKQSVPVALTTLIIIDTSFNPSYQTIQFFIAGLTWIFIFL